jgi:5-methyltetrahydrofolate--homocysteine methyltransferase
MVGANCGNGIANMIEIARQMRAAMPGIPILVHANAGAPVVEDGGRRWRPRSGARN